MRPVPSRYDNGTFLYNLFVFSAAISHCFQLIRLMRQSADEVEFTSVLQQTRLGMCSQETAKYLGNLSRELDPELDKSVMHIFFRKAPTILYNRAVVDSLPGETVRLKAEFEGDTTNMKWPGQETVTLKKGAKVMLVWNKSDKLKNGTMGLFFRWMRMAMLWCSLRKKEL